MKNFVSILTATYNRGGYLKKLYKSLTLQKLKNFEWIIADDASTDKTKKIINGFIKENKIRIVYFRSNLHIGKSVLDNLLLKNSKGEFILHCDSDDYLKKDALIFLKKKIDENKNLFKKKIIGIISQNLSTEGISQTYNKYKFPDEGKIYDWEDARKFIIGDATMLIKKKCFKNAKYPEVDFISNEGVLLENLYKKKKFVMSKKVTKIMNRNANLSVSFGNKLRYSRGSVYSIISTITKKRFNSLSFMDKFKLTLNYGRYCIHADLNYLESKNKWIISKKNKLFLIYFILSSIICLRDHLLGKVEKTHREFDRNIKKYRIEEIYNYCK